MRVRTTLPAGWIGFGSTNSSFAPELLQAGFLRQLRLLPDWHRGMLIASLQNVAAMMSADDIDASPILESGDVLPGNALPQR